MAVNQQLFIESNSELPLQFELFNIQGQLVFERQTLNKKHLDLSHLANGVYIYKIKNEEVEATGKLFIKNEECN